MKAAIVAAPGNAPVYSDFEEPVPSGGEVRIAVSAAALSPVVRSRASGAHYSSSGQFPFVVGVDGTGRLDDGRRVYFVLPKAPLGSMAEITVVLAAQCVPLPDDLDDATAAAIANPGMSSWAALKERARLAIGETVLVNGATGIAGRLAVQIARRLGAGKVIATGRNAEALGSVDADVTIPIGDAFEDALMAHFSHGIGVVLDYLWGPSAEQVIAAAARAGKEAVPIRFVHVGSASAPTIALPSAALRSSAIELMGSGIGSIPVEKLLSAAGEVLNATVPAGFKIATRTHPLSEIEQVWEGATSPRIVFRC